MLYDLLAKSNAYLLPIVLYVLAVPAMWLGRRYFEGAAYNVSLSSNIGDLALCGIVGVGISVLQSKVTWLPEWLETGWTQFGFLVIVAAVMLVLSLGQGPKQVMDLYHNIVLVPVFVTLLVLLGSIIWLNGTYGQNQLCAFLLAVWGLLLFLDVMDSRLEQRTWLRTNRQDIYCRLYR